MKSVFFYFFIAISSFTSAQFLKPGTIVVKFTPSSNLRSTGFPYQIEGANSIIPLKEKKNNSRQSRASVLDGIYLIDADENNRQKIIEDLSLKSGVQYAEILPMEQLMRHVPSDPSAHPVTGVQDYLEVIKAYEAWEITKGDPSIVIAINDTGMDLDHEDLINNYYVNPNEELNGIDDDQNGYIDDILGYDFADNDNNPNADTDISGALNHGTHVGGVAGARTNNGIGIAGVGYNTRVSAHKGFTTNGLFSTGTWEGVMYAADNGYDVANLSWGNTNGFLQFYQDLINYCVIEKDMVIVAAAGNTDANYDFYPASYENVLSVGASTLGDTKWFSGTYGAHLDLMAPGVNILSTQKNNTYNFDNGSSHASPMVAATAALVKSVFPQYNARQIMEQVRVTSDDIYDLNPEFKYLLGKGRLNVYRAVTETSSKSIRAYNISYRNEFGQYAFPGDTIELEFDLINYLSIVRTPSITLESESSYITILDVEASPGRMGTMEMVKDQTLKFVVQAHTPPSTEIDLRLQFSDENYTDFQNISITTSPPFISFGNEDLNMLVDSDGDIAYLNPSLSIGLPVSYKGNFSMNFVGLMIGNETSSIWDNSISSYQNMTRGNDFMTLQSMSLGNRPAVDLVGESSFKTVNEDYVIEQRILPGKLAYNILHYRFINTSEDKIEGIYSGFFADPNLRNKNQNHAEWDENLNGLIFYDESENVYSILAIMDENYKYVALDIGFENGNTSDLNNGNLDDETKFSFITGPNVERAGSIGEGNDIAGLVSKSLGTLDVNEFATMGVLLGFANSYAELENLVSEAKVHYQNFLDYPQVSHEFLSCPNFPFELNPQSGVNFIFYEEKEGLTPLGSGESLLIPNINQERAIFISNTDAGYPEEITQINIDLIDQVAKFRISPDTLYLDQAGLNQIRLTDQSIQSLTWDWNFGNGSAATIQHPSTYYDETGEYSISLSVTNELGCQGSTTQNLIVAERPPPPVISDFNICNGESIDLSHPTTTYSIYDPQGNRLAKNQNLTIGPIITDSTLLIAQWSEFGFESLPVPVSVNVDDMRATFDIYPDTTSASTTALFFYSGINANTYQWTVDGNIQSTENQFSLDITDEIELSLTVTNSTCVATSTETIDFESSPAPEIQDITVCPNESLIISPENGTYFGFYRNSELSDLIHKGTQLEIFNPVTETISVVGLDSVIPSLPSSFNITVSDFKPNIIADPATLDFMQRFIVKFSSDVEISSAKWFVDDVLTETVSSPILILDTPGIYNVRLEATDQFGCVSIDEIEYEVKYPVLGSRESKEIKISPNPNKGIFSINSEKKLLSVTLMDLSGKPIKSWDGDNIISVQEVGIYVLKVITKDSTSFHRIIIQ